MKKRFVIAAVVAAVGGCALHFFYELLPFSLVAIFAPINESPWEHLKLLFWPTLLAASVLAQKSAHPKQLWSAFFLVLLIMPLFLLGMFYLLGALGLDSLPTDIALYFLTMFGGFALAYALYHKPWVARFGGFALMLVILYGAILILFSFAAPPLPIFQAPA